MDDESRDPSRLEIERRLRGVPVVKPEQLDTQIDAVVISSDAYEYELYQKARTVFDAKGVPVLRIYGEDKVAREEPDASVRRLVEKWGVSDSDARWLVANRDERHDATLPMLPPERTEMHLRRYELAATLVAGKRVLDIACGTGYGSRFLLDQGQAASVIGMDLDAAAVEYARRRHGAGVPQESLRFIAGGATSTGIGPGALDAIVSFETIEHVPDAAGVLSEFKRILRPDGVVVMSTPNDTGPTDHHAHSFTRESFETLLKGAFADVRMFGQVAGDELFADGLPEGIFRLGEGTPRPAIFIAICR
ncbi:MAG TPA: class I SAM-dependent methyltransferase [Sideroxyarcus sp.]|nr:class I SAM-dependent methyltransferase [Sideroxyarcus sp.]